MFMMVPAQVLIGTYLECLKEFPPVRGTSLSITTGAGSVDARGVEVALPGQ
jgi:hypothetical protein